MAGRCAEDDAESDGWDVLLETVCSEGRMEEGDGGVQEKANKR
jgi:hypothetical protein